MQPPLETSGRTRVRFVQNEIDLAQTFLDAAEIEDHDNSVAARARSAAEEGYVTALANINAIRDADDWGRLMAQIFDLKERLGRLRA